MKKIVSCLAFCIALTISSAVFAQEKVRGGRLSTMDEANMTSDQKLVHETNRRSKNGKKRVSTKEKVRIQEKQARRARNIKQPKPPKQRKPRK